MKRTRITSRFGLPLLAKELIEQAARKRTYAFRVLYACLLFTASYLFFHEILRASAANPLAVLGHGREMFEVLMGLQFAGTYLFMPAIACGVLTQEKERNSLMLLFLSRLGPWAIVLEKLLSRLVPMICYLLLSLPLFGCAYCLGGVDSTSLWTGVWMLALTAFWCGSLAVCCSAWFRTTVGAFVATYLIGIALFIGPSICAAVLFWGQPSHQLPFAQLLVQWGIYDNGDQMVFLFFTPVQYFVRSGSTAGEPVFVFLRSLPILLSSLAFLVLARVFVVRRAFVAPVNPLLTFFRWADRTFARLNENRVTRGIVLVHGGSSLPDLEPLAWRETTKRSLGRPRYLMRVFLAIEIPVALALLGIAFYRGGNLDGLAALIVLLWIVAALVVAVQSASLIAGERTHQTLDVIATTPLAGREILLQKFRGVRRLMFVLSIPFVTVILFETVWLGMLDHLVNGAWNVSKNGWFLYSTCALLSVGIYLPLVAWLSTLIGLVVRTQARAIVGAVGAIAGWCVLPLVFIVLPLMLLLDLPKNEPAPVWSFLMLLSPATIIGVNESHELGGFAHLPWLAVAMNFTAYGFMLFLFRHVCLANADRFLGRVESPVEVAPGTNATNPAFVKMVEGKPA